MTIDLGSLSTLLSLGTVLPPYLKKVDFKMFSECLKLKIASTPKDTPINLSYTYTYICAYIYASENV